MPHIIYADIESLAQKIDVQIIKKILQQQK